MRAIAAVLLFIAVVSPPASAQTDAERAEALRSAAAALRDAIATLEEAAATLEGGAAESEDETGAGGSAGSDSVVFLDPLNDSPLEIPSDDVTDAVERFHATGENPYAGDEAAIEAGEALYGKLCAACHLTDGTGRIGPSLVDDTWQYPRTGTDKGQFEIIYAGGAGAMQAFSKRISQDEMLKVIAYLDVLGDR